MQNSFEISYPLQAPTGDPFRFYEPPVPKQKSRRPKPKTAPVAPELISTETESQPDEAARKDSDCHSRIEEGKKTVGESHCASLDQRKRDKCLQMASITDHGIGSIDMHPNRSTAVEGGSSENMVEIKDEPIALNVTLGKLECQLYTNGQPEGANPTMPDLISSNYSSEDMEKAVHYTEEILEADTVLSDLIDRGDIVCNVDGQHSYFFERPTQDAYGTSQKDTKNELQPILHDPALSRRNDTTVLQEPRSRDDHSDSDSYLDRLSNTMFKNKRKLSRTTDTAVRKRRYPTPNKTLEMLCGNTRSKMEACRNSEHNCSLCYSEEPESAASGGEVSPNLNIHKNVSAPSLQMQRAHSIDRDEQEEEYEVECIVDARLRRGKLQYRVKWLGCQDDPVWYNARNFKNSPYKLRDFHDANFKHPGPPKSLGYWIRCWEDDRDADDYPWDNKPVSLG